MWKCGIYLRKWKENRLESADEKKKENMYIIHHYIEEEKIWKEK